MIPHLFANPQWGTVLEGLVEVLTIGNLLKKAESTLRVG
jgi:hypothetical protein